MAASPLQRGSLYLYITLQLSLIIGYSAPVGYRMKNSACSLSRGNVLSGKTNGTNIFTLFPLEPVKAASV